MINSNLKQKRKENGISQCRLSVLANVPLYSIAQCEQGIKLPLSKHRDALANYFNVKEKDIFPKEAEANK